MEVKFKKLMETAVTPTRGSASAAGCDLYASEGVTIDPGCMRMVHTGLSVEIPEGFFGGVYARSGLASKRGLRPANCVGVIDSDYRGEVMVALYNDSFETQTVEAGERVAQMIITKYEPADFVEVDELDKTVRGEGGFGSTGK